MQGSGRFIIRVGGLTTLFLFYVHLNVMLFNVSYSINHKSKDLTEQNEKLQHLKYEVDQLKSPHRLAEQIKIRELELDLPQKIQVVRVPVTQKAPFEPFEEKDDNSIVGGLFNFLGRWVGVAQAKTDS